MSEPDQRAGRVHPPPVNLESPDDSPLRSAPSVQGSEPEDGPGRTLPREDFSECRRPGAQTRARPSKRHTLLGHAPWQGTEMQLQRPGRGMQWHAAWYAAVLRSQVHGQGPQETGRSRASRQREPAAKADDPLAQGLRVAVIEKSPQRNLSKGCERVSRAAIETERDICQISEKHRALLRRCPARRGDRTHPYGEPAGVSDGLDEGQGCARLRPRGLLCGGRPR